jgi:RNA-directed DNA polymerase
MQDGSITRSTTGTPQGGVISPCLCNVYLHRLDRQWTERGTGTLVRYADDLLALCRTRAQAEAALAALRLILAELGLELKDAKTRIVHLEEGGEGVDFLGFHHRWVRANRAKHVQFLARWPSRRAMQHARDRVGEITARERLLLPVEDVVQDLNGFLCGWAGYFRYRELGPSLQPDRASRAQPARAVHGQAPSTVASVRLAAGDLPVARSPGLDQARGNCRRAQAPPGLEGIAECRR